MNKRISPQTPVRHVAWADVGDVLGDVVVSSEYLRQNRRELSVDEEAHSAHDATTTV